MKVCVALSLWCSPEMQFEGGAGEFLSPSLSLSLTHTHTHTHTLTQYRPLIRASRKAAADW
jgi:hypothetical protein